MKLWVTFRKLNRIHRMLFVHYYHHKPTAICTTNNIEIHLGWLNRLLEIGGLSIDE